MFSQNLLGKILNLVKALLLSLESLGFYTFAIYVHVK